MRTTRTYYEILGLPRSATLVQIKRRYKELVRKYHPDVAADKIMAHRLFLQIREAYEVLSDPVRRKAYDATLDMDQAPRRTASPGGTSGRTTVSPTAQLIKDAQFSFIQKRFGEAIERCKEVLASSPRNARAYAIMGDAYRAQGKSNSAVKAYSYAVQYDPTDLDSQRKLEKIVGKRMSQSRRPQAQVPGHASRATLLAIWWSVAFFLILMLGAYPGKPVGWFKEFVPQVSLWSTNLIALMAAASCVVGMLLCMSGLLRHPDEELVFQSGGNWAVVPTGLILLIGSGFFFVGAAVFYIVVGLLQGSLSKSVLTAFAGVAGIVLLTTVVYVPEAKHQVLLFGGNVSFLAMLFGWYIGSMFRPLSD
jgi:curved DNA-binding protein CbpA